ncbi:MAG: peptidoglycan-binding domain-containing protein [Actinomycetota bacterium]
MSRSQPLRASLSLVLLCLGLWATTASTAWASSGIQYRSLVGNATTGGTTPSTQDPTQTPAPPDSTTPPTKPGPATEEIPAALRGNGMWIWQIPRAHGGNIAKIIAQAKASKITTLFIKSADGTGTWSQFTKEMVAAFHAGGLKVCGWHYVYGRYPLTEAAASAYAKAQGADCFIIDAEVEFEKHYVAASIYMRELRRLVGPSYPIGLAAFPYVDYHPSFPYSVFLAPGGAQYNLPQMYWKAIGTTVRAVYEHAYRDNSIYKSPILPIGQTYDGTTVGELTSFRKYGGAYQAAGISWWDWTNTTKIGWKTLGADLPITAGTITSGSPSLSIGFKGDQVVWAQMLLVAAGARIKVDGIFASSTRAAVRSFQLAHGIPVSGGIGDKTWAALKEFTPKPVAWDRLRATSLATQAASGSPSRSPLRGGPASSNLPAVAYEIPLGQTLGRR